MWLTHYISMDSADLEQTPQLRREKGGAERDVVTMRSCRGSTQSQSPGPSGQPAPSNSPGFPLAIDKEVVKQEEGSLLDVACRDF